jgi:hypothetical protein
VEVVVLLPGGRPALLPPRRVDLPQPVGQPEAAVLGELPQGRQPAQLLGPGGAVAPPGQPAADPAQATRLDHLQDGSAAHEDLVGHDVAHARPGELVEDRQHRPRARASGLRPAAQPGHAGGPRAQQDGEEAVGDGEADALGLGGGGELGEAVVVGGDGGGEAPEVVTTGLELVQLLPQAQGLLAVAVEVVAHGTGLAVDVLPAGAALAGQPCDVAVATEEGGGGAGEALQDG